jgi:hypothetical protein
MTPEQLFETAFAVDAGGARVFDSDLDALAARRPA